MKVVVIYEWAPVTAEGTVSPTYLVAAGRGR